MTGAIEDAVAPAVGTTDMCLVARRGIDVIDTVVVGVEALEQGVLLNVVHLAVEPTWRQQGVGTVLIGMVLGLEAGSTPHPNRVMVYGASR